MLPHLEGQEPNYWKQIELGLESYFGEPEGKKYFKLAQEVTEKQMEKWQLKV